MYVNFTTNTTQDGQCPTKSLLVAAEGTWGSGTLALKLFDETLDGYVTVDSWTTDVAKEIVLGAGAKFQFAFTGGSGQDVDVVYKGAYGD